MNDRYDEPDSEWSHRAARRGDWIALNDSGPAVPARIGGRDTEPGEPGPSKPEPGEHEPGEHEPDYDVTLRCRLDLAALRFLAERADALGMEIIEARPVAGGSGHAG